MLVQWNDTTVVMLNVSAFDVKCDIMITESVIFIVSLPGNHQVLSFNLTDIGGAVKVCPAGKSAFMVHVNGSSFILHFQTDFGKNQRPSFSSHKKWNSYIVRCSKAVSFLLCLASKWFVRWSRCNGFEHCTFVEHSRMFLQSGIKKEGPKIYLPAKSW